LGAVATKPDPSVTVSVTWIIITAFAAAFGTALWKFMPWAIKRALDEQIDKKLLPMVTEVHDRINEHMENEDGSLASVRERMDDLAEQQTIITTTLDNRTALFDEMRETMLQTQEVLQHHMVSDEQQFANGAEALMKGQRDLLNEIAAVSQAIRDDREK